MIKADGTSLLLANVSELTAEIIQKGEVKEMLTYPSSKLREGTSTSQIELELSTDVSATLQKGRVTVRWTIVGANALFQHEGIQKDIITEDVLTVI